MLGGVALTKPMLATAGELTAKLKLWVSAVPVTDTCRLSLAAIAPQPASRKVKVARPVLVDWLVGVSVPLPATVQAEVNTRLTGLFAVVPLSVTVRLAWP